MYRGIGQDEADDETYIKWGKAYYNKGDYDKAIAGFTAVIDGINDCEDGIRRFILDFLEAYINRGGAYYGKGTRTMLSPTIPKRYGSLRRV